MRSRVSGARRSPGRARSAAAALAIAASLALPGAALSEPLFPDPALAPGWIAYAVALGDFNADGRTDVVTAGARVAVFLGQGDGTYGAPLEMIAGISPRSAVVADFNRDGRQDLALHNEGSQDVTVLLGGSGGMLGAPIRTTGIGSPRALAAGDLNGDGAPDLVAGNGGGSTSYALLGRGDGTFQVAGLSVGEAVVSAAVADFDRDGHEDLVLGGTGSGSIHLLLGRGAGAFGPASAIRLVSQSLTALGVAAADLDADGDADIAATVNDGGVHVLLGTGDGGFLAPARYPAGTLPGSVAAGDLDGDGRLDLAVANRSGDDVAVFAGRGDGTFQDARFLPAGRSPQTLVIGDLDGDGARDLAVACAGSFDVAILANRGGGAFGAPSFPANDYPVAITSADFDRDGRADLAVANHSGLVSLLLATGPGRFGPPAGFPVGAAPADVAGGDFDGDGRRDLAVANRASSDISVLIGNGDGTFARERRVPAINAPASLAAGDFDGDGSTDLAVANEGADLLQILLADGRGSLRPADTYATGSRPRTVALGDLDRDGRGDLVVADFGVAGVAPSDLAVFLSRGDGSFTALPRSGIPVRPLAIALADFDADGRRDLATANYSGGASIFFGNGDGTFRPEVPVAAQAYPDSLAVGDFDADGRADLALANATSHRVDVLLNASGSFPGPPLRFIAGKAGIDLAAGDFDGDPRADLAVVNRDSDDVSLLLNQGPFPDSDGDGTTDDLDRCTDTDADGFGDPGFPANTCRDDNCPRAYNPRQEDADHDGLGNVCDTCPLDPFPDPDEDGICGEPDNCPAVPNPDQGNFDADGEGDVCDLDDGLIYIKMLDRTTLQWDREAGFDRFNLYRGDLGVLAATGVYTQDPRSVPSAGKTCRLQNAFAIDGFTPGVGRGALYIVSGSAGGLEGGLGTDSDGNPRPNDNPCPRCDRPFADVLITSNSGIDTRQYLLIDNETDWCAFWARATANDVPPPACDSAGIDFSREVVLAAAAGYHTDGCWGIRITCVGSDASASDLKALVQWTVNLSGCGCPDAIVTPLHVVKVDRPVASAVFEEIEPRDFCQP